MLAFFFFFFNSALENYFCQLRNLQLLLRSGLPSYAVLENKGLLINHWESLPIWSSPQLSGTQPSKIPRHLGTQLVGNSETFHPTSVEETELQPICWGCAAVRNTRLFVSSVMLGELKVTYSKVSSGKSATHGYIHYWYVGGSWFSLFPISRKIRKGCSLKSCRIASALNSTS